MGLDAKRGESRAAVAVRYMQYLHVRACVRVWEWECVVRTMRKVGIKKTSGLSSHGIAATSSLPPPANEPVRSRPDAETSPVQKRPSLGADVAKSRASVPILDCRPVRRRSRAASQPRGHKHRRGWRCRCRHTPTGKERATTGTRRLILNREQLDEVCGPGHSPQLAQKRDQLEVIEYDFDEHRRPLLGVTIVDAVEAVEGRLAVWAAVAFSVATRSTLNGTNP